MKVHEIVTASSARTRDAIQGIARFAKLERVLAVFCAFTPGLLIWADQGRVRGSISAYYDLSRAQMFYVPLTTAAMLFVVNGVVKDKQLYNTFLGCALAGLLLFNMDVFHTIHTAFAAAFFVGNVVVIGCWTSVRGWKVRGPLIAVIALAMAGWYTLGWFNLFWAEWISLAIIATHYVIESFVDDSSAGAEADVVAA